MFFGKVTNKCKYKIGKKKDTSYAQWAKSTVDERMTVHTLNDATGVGETTKLTANCLTSHSVSHMKRV